MIYICKFKPCSREFEDCKSAYRKFCSTTCNDLSRMKVNIDRLKQLVMTGETKSEIARLLGCDKRNIGRWIDRCGLAGVWREKRFAPRTPIYERRRTEIVRLRAEGFLIGPWKPTKGGFEVIWPRRRPVRPQLQSNRIASSDACQRIGAP